MDDVTYQRNLGEYPEGYFCLFFKSSLVFLLQADRL